MKKLSTVCTIFMVTALTTVNSYTSPISQEVNKAAPKQDDENRYLQYSSNWEGTEDFLTKTHRPIPSVN